MLAVSQSATKPFSPNDSAGSGEGFPFGLASTVQSPKAIRPRRLPRDGPNAGGGRMCIENRELLEKGLWDCESPGRQSDDLPIGLAKGNRHSHGRRPSGVSSSRRTHTPTGASVAGRSSADKSSKNERGASESGSRFQSEAGESKHDSSHQKLTPAERKRADVKVEWEKLEEQRQKSQKDIQERIEKQHAWRDERMKRLSANLACSDNLAARTAVALLERDAHEERRRRDLYEAWEQRVFLPLATQAFEHMSRSKSVRVVRPDQPPNLKAPVDSCPVRKQLVEFAREQSFHHVASQVLGHSQSAPDLRYHGASVVPYAKTRPTLEPNMWSQVKLQGTACGHLAQMAEQGEHFRRGRRGGSDVHLPDVSDGVEVHGTRVSRIHGLGDTGILRGSLNTHGEAFGYRSCQTGAGSAAPVQDHFCYQTGDMVTNLEFPRGRRCFPERL